MPDSPTEDLTELRTGGQDAAGQVAAGQDAAGEATAGKRSEPTAPAASMPDAPTEDLTDLVAGPASPDPQSTALNGLASIAASAADTQVAAIVPLRSPQEGSAGADALDGAVLSDGEGRRRKKRKPKASSAASSGEGSPADPPADASAETAQASGSDEPALRIRDVWSAARARRKTLRAEMRRFTVRSRRRRTLWLVALGALVVLVVGTVGAAYSPLLAVREIQVAGTSTLDAAAVQDALSDQVGTPLPLVDESAVKAALVEFPLVESYTLEARPPHTLVVRIVERTPIGVVQSDAGFSLVDAAGVVLATTQDRPQDRPQLTVRGGAGTPAFAAVGTVLRALPQEILAQVTAVSATTRDDVTLTLGATNTQVIWGSVENTALKVLALEGAMKARTPDVVSAYDVSSPGAVVFR